LKINLRVLKEFNVKENILLNTSYSDKAKIMRKLLKCLQLKSLHLTYFNVGETDLRNPTEGKQFTHKGHSN
jgi:hypothetical protein